MNNRGKGSGLALILILFVVPIVAFLVMKPMSGLSAGGPAQQEKTHQRTG